MPNPACQQSSERLFSDRKFRRIGLPQSGQLQPHSTSHLCRSATDGNRSSIGNRSTYGQGSTFWFAVRLKKVQ